MRLGQHEVDYVAALARIALDDDERAQLAAQLSSILTHIDVLRSLDTSQISPTAYAAAAQNVTRADVARPSLPVEVVLQNAPDRFGSQLKVDAVFEA